MPFEKTAYMEFRLHPSEFALLLFPQPVLRNRSSGKHIHTGPPLLGAWQNMIEPYWIFQGHPNSVS